MSEKTNQKPVKCGCGGEAEIIKHTFHKLSPSYGIECTNCHAESWQFYNTEAEAIEAWNTAMGERTAKAEWSEVDGCHLCGECGFAVCPNCDVYCAGCGARLEWK